MMLNFNQSDIVYDLIMYAISEAIQGPGIRQAARSKAWETLQKETP